MDTTSRAHSDTFRNFDLRDPDLVDNPYPTYERLRAQCPVAHSDLYGGYWVVSRYADVKRVLRDPSRFSSRQLGIPDLKEPAGARIPLQLDPPEHGVYRKALLTAFSPERAEQLRPLVRSVAVRLIESMQGKPECEFIREYAIPLPFQVILTWLGIPEEGWPLLAEMEDAGIRRQSVDGVSRAEAIFDAKARVDEYFRELLAERRSIHRDGDDRDFLSFLLDIRIGGRRLDESELLRICMLMFSAGLHTTTSTLGNMMYLLAERPALRDRIAADPAVIPRAVEELMRYESIVAMTRVANEDVELGDVTIRKDEPLLLLLGSADRDEAAFADPDAVDFDRDVNPHIGFGAGPHRCLGSHFARVELQVSLEEIHRLMPRYRLTPGRPVERTLGGERSTNVLWLSLERVPEEVSK